MRFGRRTAAIFRAFNLRCGIGAGPRASVQALRLDAGDGPAKGQAIGEQWERMVDIWYAEVGYDRKTGKPLPKTLKELGLDWLAKELWGSPSTRPPDPPPRQRHRPHDGRSLPVAQALAVKDGRIVEVGGTDEILWLREDDYELIDLDGRTVVPGSTDADLAFSIRGTLAPGQRADFQVLSDDPLRLWQGITRTSGCTRPGSTGGESWLDLDRPGRACYLSGPCRSGA